MDIKATSRFDLEMLSAAIAGLKRGKGRGAMMAVIYGEGKLMKSPWWMRLLATFVRWRFGISNPQAWAMMLASEREDALEQACADGLIDHILNGQDADPANAGGFNQSEIDVVKSLCDIAVATQAMENAA